MNENNDSLAELKLRLIQQILEMDFDEITKHFEVEKQKVKKYHERIDLNDEIDQLSADNETKNMAFFKALSMKNEFYIDDIQSVFNDNIYLHKHLHIYFIEIASEVSLLFRFNSAESNDHEIIKFSSNETTYALENHVLKKCGVKDAIKGIEDFKIRYDKCKFNTQVSSYTQYITFDTINIQKKFISFPDATQFLAAAKEDANTGTLRQNIILKIDKSYVVNPISTLDDVFFNIGNMQP